MTGPCLAGSWCGSGATAPTECAEGTHSAAVGLAHVGECSETRPGHYSTKGSTVETPCGGPSLFCPGGEGEPRTVGDGTETFTDVSLFNAPADHASTR